MHSITAEGQDPMHSLRERDRVCVKEGEKRLRSWQRLPHHLERLE